MNHVPGQDSDVNFFEGAEKLLEIWFSTEKLDGGEATSETYDLRTIKIEDWKTILALVKCEILSKSSSAELDSYVLSESSMFISKTRFILKTCGKTTLLYATKPVLDLARSKCGFDKVLDVFYSHKNFVRSDLQRGLHRSFDNEVEYLDSVFTGVKSAAYQIGNMREQCWNLYTIHNHLSCTVPEPDQTLEIIMTGLDPSRMETFYKKNCDSGEEVAKKSGIQDLLLNAAIDHHLFDPCGYSMNAIIDQKYYSTIHVTPENQFSYVSFETNIPKCNMELIKKVVALFKPKNFMITLFSNDTSETQPLHKDIQTARDMGCFRKTDHFLSQLKNYLMTYAFYSVAHDDIS